MSYRPLRPNQVDFDLQLITLQDAIEHLLIVLDLGNGASTHGRLARAAVMESYRRFPDEHQWKHYERTASINTIAPQTEGTIEFDSATRTVTLSDAVWPADAEFMKVEFDSQVCKVASRDSDTEITLVESNCPSQDSAAGTSYTLFQDCYLLPLDYRKGGCLHSLDESNHIISVSREVIMQYEVSNYSPVDRPRFYSIRSTGDYMGGLCVQLSPPPLTVKKYDFSYTASPRPFNLFSGNTINTEYSSGLISTSGTTVTGSGVEFSDAMVGCVLRSSSVVGEAPTGQTGSAQNDNPYSEQRVVMSVTSGTELVVDQAFDSNLSGTSYTIGSPIDILPEAMATAFFSMCIANITRMSRMKTAEQDYANYLRELKVAIASDNRRLDISTRIPDSPRTLGDISRQGG